MKNELSVVGNRHRLAKHGMYFTLNKTVEELRPNQSYSLSYILKRNEDMKFNGEVINIDWSKTFEMLDKACSQKDEKRTIDSVRLELIKLLDDEVKGEKMSLKLPTTESYLEVKRLNRLENNQVKDYVGWAEQTLSNLKEFKIVKESSNLDPLRDEYEQLKGESPDKRWKEERLIEEINKLKN